MTRKLKASVVPQVGHVYVVAYSNLNTYALSLQKSFVLPESEVLLLVPKSKPAVGTKVLLLDKLFESTLLPTNSDVLLFKFLDLSNNENFYLRMAPVNNKKTEAEIFSRAHHAFWWYFETVEGNFHRLSVNKVKKD